MRLGVSAYRTGGANGGKSDGAQLSLKTLILWISYLVCMLNSDVTKITTCLIFSFYDQRTILVVGKEFEPAGRELNVFLDSICIIFSCLKNTNYSYKLEREQLNWKSNPFANFERMKEWERDDSSLDI